MDRVPRCRHSLESTEVGSTSLRVTGPWVSLRGDIRVLPCCPCPSPSLYSYGRLSPTCEIRRLQAPGPILLQLRGFKEFRGQVRGRGWIWSLA